MGLRRDNFYSSYNYCIVPLSGDGENFAWLNNNGENSSSFHINSFRCVDSLLFRLKERYFKTAVNGVSAAVLTDNSLYAVLNDMSRDFSAEGGACSFASLDCFR